MFQPVLYEAAASALFAPFGGIERIRRRVIYACEARPGTTILELGCGPGALTRLLVERGAQVTGVDASPDMIAEANRRVRGATFRLADVRTFEPPGRFDTILVSFVLHELRASDWQSLLRRLANALASGGRLVLADHALPPAGAGSVWRWVLRAVETRAIDQWLDTDVLGLLTSSGLTIREDVPLAGRRVRLIVGGPS